jgi:hypothetical protein
LVPDAPHGLNVTHAQTFTPKSWHFSVADPPHIAQTAKSLLLEALAGTTLVIGAGVTVFADPGWARALSIVCAILTFGLATAELDEKA